MTAFEDLKTQWGKQEIKAPPKEGYKAILEKVSSIKKKQKITNVILAITVGILLAFFMYIAAYNHSMTAFGLAVMITALVIRILLEVLSTKKLNMLELDAEASLYKKNVNLYYQERKTIHFIWTPVLILAYILGFVLLLPSFKENLSYGFFLYIIISFPIIMIVLGTFIYQQIANELNIIKELKQ
ncbi:hypothetical protein [Cellulophaga sp. L1A9]|uniref:hypothetical protein n=1 Tax=Cellulophaga sp. L1A9 TaxID=2686362 RepID=UPI00131E6003|nr:hypothetical protein [Cellulophaga sp. L1A9]